MRRESDFKKSRGGLGWGKEGVEEEMGDDDVHDQDDEEEDYNDNIDDDDDKKIKSWKTHLHEASQPVFASYVFLFDNYMLLRSEYWRLRVQ